MKTLIVYASKYGCTADCAKYLAGKIPGGAVLADINKPAKPIELSGFDTIIIGGSVYIGKMAKKLREFCSNNLDPLLKNKVGIFLCCALADQMDEALKNSLPSALLEAAKITMSFGSEARLDRMGFVDKAMIKAVTKGDFSGFKISHEAMDEFVKALMS